MSDKIIRLVDVSNDAAHISPADTLKDALADVGKSGALENGSKVLVLALDDSDDGYSITFYQSGMKLTQCVSLCEVAKQIFVNSVLGE